MTAIAHPSRVILTPRLWRPGPAAELLREPLADAEIARVPLKRLREAFDRWLLAGGKSNYLELKIVDEVLGATAFAGPATIYFGLWDGAALTDAANGGTAGEVTGGSYDRVAKTSNTTNFASANPKVNSTAIAFPTATANWNSGNTLEQVGALDGNLKTSGDNLLLWSDLTTPKAVLSGDTPQFNASAFSWTED